MMFCSLFSGSSGNSIFLKYKDTRILIDCGVSGKRIAASLAELTIDACKLSAIIVTHEHNDHINSVGIMSRRYNLPIYANCGTWEGMQANIGKVKEKSVKDFTTGGKFEIGDIVIEPFPLPHDAAEPVGYNFYLGDKKLTLATDMGHVSDAIRNSIKGCHTILIESNHDVEMLKNGNYPIYLKKRILGEKGHLSNDVSGELSLWLAQNGTINFLLGHLSKENNTPEVAFDTVQSAFCSGGVKVMHDVTLNVAGRESSSRIFNSE